MLKKVDSSQLRVGMFIHELDCGWMEHPFVRNRFKFSKDEEIQKVLNVAKAQCLLRQQTRGPHPDADHRPVPSSGFGRRRQIVGLEAPEQWKLDPMQYLCLAQNVRHALPAAPGGSCLIATKESH